MFLESYLWYSLDSLFYDIWSCCACETKSRELSVLASLGSWVAVLTAHNIILQPLVHKLEMTLVHILGKQIYTAFRVVLLVSLPHGYLGGLQPFIQIARKKCAVNDDVSYVCVLEFRLFLSLCTKTLALVSCREAELKVTNYN
jgi:hypothetical protein